MATILKGSDIRPQRRVRSAVVAPGGHRKSWLSLCLPEEWGEIIYIAADLNSQNLSSILEEDIDRLHVVVPDGKAQRDPQGKITKTDWISEMYEMAQREWVKDFPKAGVIVWDHWTQTAEEVLRENAVKNYFSDKGPVQGSNVPTVNQAQKFASPQPGDYNMAQQSVLMATEWFVRQPLHVVGIYQEGQSEASARNGEGLLYGPQTIGQKGPRQIPNKYDSVFYLTIDQGKGTTNTGNTVVHIIPEEYHTARLNTVRIGEVPPTKVLGKDPKERRDFWRWVLEMGSSVGA